MVSTKNKQPLNILYVGFNFPPLKIGGVSIYTYNLLTELSKRGHRVSHFYSEKMDWRLSPYLCIKEINSIRYIQLINSPILYPPTFNLIEDEISNAQIEKAFQKTLELCQPDIVHIQDFFGISASLIQIAKEYGSIIVTSLHNYYPICPSFNLFHRTTNQICTELNCETCISKLIPKNIFIKKLSYAYPNKMLALHNLLLRLGMEHLCFIRYTPDRMIRLLAQRRQSFSDVINTAHLTLAVSHKVKELFITYLNIMPNKIWVNHIGSKASELITCNNKSKNKSPVTIFIFLGRLIAKKGFQNVLQAFIQVDQTKAKLLVYADLDKEWRRKKREFEGKYNIEFRDKYRYEDLNEILHQADVGVVSPIWHDNAPQVLLEMFIAGLPVIGSNVGGIRDFIVHNKNGLLYQYDNIDDLREKMQMCISNPSLLIHFRKHIPRIKTMKDHAVEIERMYSYLIKNKS